MKKLLSVILAVCLLASLFAGCGAKPAESTAPAPSESTPAEGSTAPAPADGAKLKVGYVVNLMSHQWYQNICNGAKARAEELGVELLLADANNDSATQITACENFIASKVDILVVTPVDAKALANVTEQAKAAGIPVITESNRVDNTTTLVGISNETGGQLAGEWFVDYAKKNNIDPKVLLIGTPANEDCRQRVSGFKTALEASGMKYEIKQEVDGKGIKEKAIEVATDALTANPDINVIFGINDDSATGGMQAYKAAGLDESKLTVIGFGFEGSVGQNALMGNTAYKAALAMFPNYVGVALIDAAVKISEGETLPEHYETPITVMTPDNFSTFYNKVGDGYEMNFEAIRGLEKK